MRTMTIPTQYYQHFDADFALNVPGEGYGGWHRAELPISMAHSALVVMHAWDAGTRETFPGWHRAVEYLPRSYDICREVLPPLLDAARRSGLKLIHVVSDQRHYYERYDGYEQAKNLAGPEPAPPAQIGADPVLERLLDFRAGHVFPGKHNEADIDEGFRRVRFPREAEPRAGEPIVATTNQLFTVCREAGVNHLIYTGFAINWCLLLAPGGMADMSKHGLLCSAVRQAVTAVENRETARREANKEAALWRVALAYGFVYDADDLVRGLRSVGCERTAAEEGESQP